ncbi:MAG: amidohydrolase family protein [Deltaproteobacteria bacterium]|nr:amidohydrolase family protein [Deltaproteobacteria bacterium]
MIYFQVKGLMKYYAAVIAVLLCMCSPVAADELVFIDAHSQIDQYIEFNEIIKLMDKAGVTRTILALRGKNKPEELIEFANRYPDRITPAIRSKGTKYYKNKLKKYRRFLDRQLNMPEFGAMAEVIIWHAEKWKAPTGKIKPAKVVIRPDDIRVQDALAICLEKNWPFTLHIEFAAAGDERHEFMAAFEDLLRQHPSHPFVLIHMGQLQAPEVKRLISTHKNIYFIASKSNPIHGSMATGKAIVNLFDGSSFAPEWKTLIVENPDRFIFGIDNTWAKDWRWKYVREVELWRKALKELPGDVANAVAHVNAEKLWRLPVARK